MHETGHQPDIQNNILLVIISAYEYTSFKYIYLACTINGIVYIEGNLIYIVSIDGRCAIIGTNPLLSR